MTDQPINSRSFWEEYFVENWAANDGPGQSRHFMLELLSHLALPDLRWLIASAPSVLDWGCATGEGTALLAKVLPSSRVTGLDFAELAVETATRRHPRPTFLWDPEGAVQDQFDAIVTSNCLEHFEDPLSIASAHIAHCRYLYLALVPYREHPLHDQHFAQFRDESFPDRLGTFSRIAVQPFPVDNDYWPGWQVLAAYGSDDYLRLREHTDHSLPELAALKSALSELLTLSTNLASVSAKVRAEQAANVELTATIQGKAAEVAAIEAQAGATSTELRAVRYQLERAGQESAGLLEALGAERHLREVADREIENLTARLAEIADQLGQSTRLLVREETRVLRPILRRTWRSGRAVARHLPQRWQDSTRRVAGPRRPTSGAEQPAGDFLPNGPPTSPLPGIDYKGRPDAGWPGRRGRR